MAKNEQVYTIKLDAELQDLQSKLAKARQSLDGLFKSGNAPKGLASNFEKIEALIGRISDKSKQAPSKGLFSGMEKDISNLELLFGELTRNIDGLKNSSKNVKLELFPPEEKKKIEDAVKSIDKYAAAIKNLKDKQKELESASKVVEKARSAADAAKADKVKIKRKKEEKQTERDSLSGQVVALELAPEKNAVKIAKLKGEIAKLDLEIRNLNTDYNQASKVLTEVNKAVETADKNYGKLSDQLKTMETSALAMVSEETEKAGVAFEKFDATNVVKTMEDAAEATEDFVDETLKTAPAITKAKSATEDYANATDKMTDEVKEAAEAERQFQEAQSRKNDFERKIKQFLGLSGAAQVLRGALRDAMSTITELDATMTEMAVVTDLTVGDYWDQLPEYSKQASELGVSINDAYKAATLYYQQGLKSNEVTKISAETLKMARIAGLSAEDATNKMTAALRGFNMELNETSAQRVSDVYSQLAAITASDVNEISNAMTKTASIAHSAGMEFETTAAFLSQIIETTRESAETAGTALKTVIARFQELKKDPSEIGEVDGEMVDANAIETALRSVGVSLRDTNGQFRELDDVFLELSSKWSSLDKNTQRYIATIAAGSRQQSRFIAMMSDYSRTQELVTEANNSAGASAKQFEKTQDSLASKMERLKNAWHEFTMGIMESDLVKFGVDVLTKFLEIVNKATSAFDGMGGSIMKIVSVLAIFKLGQKIFDKFKQPILNLFTQVTNAAGKEGFAAGYNWGKGAAEGAKKAASENSPKPTEPKKDEKAKDNQKENSRRSEKEPEQPETSNWARFKQGGSQAGKGLKSLFHETGDLKKEKAYLKELKKQETLENRRLKVAKAQQKLEDAKSSKAKNKDDLITEANREVKLATNGLQEYEQQQLKVQKTSESTWKNIGNGLKEMGSAALQSGEAITGVGISISMVGSAFAALGLEELGEGIAQLGNGITLVGTALKIIPPILNAISAHPIIAAITIGVGALLLLVKSITDAQKEASVEARVEKSTARAREAEQVAKETKERYDELDNSLSQLESKYDGMKELVRGTREWNEAVQEINATVLDLVKEYPDLADLIENHGGVLTLDIDSEEVKNILQQSKENYVQAKGIEVAAEAKAARERLTLQTTELEAYKEIANSRGVGEGVTTGTLVGTLGAIAGAVIGTIIAPGVGTAIGGASGAALFGGAAGTAAGTIEASRTDNDEQLQTAVIELAKKAKEKGKPLDETEIKEFLDGKIHYSEADLLAETFSEDSEALMSFAETVAEAQEQQELYYLSMVANAQSLLDLSNYTEEQMSQMTNIVDSNRMLEIENEQKEKWEKESKDSDKKEFEQAKKDLAKSQYGAGARVEGNKIVDEKGETLKEFENTDAWVEAIAAAEATKEAAHALEKAPEMVQTILEGIKSDDFMSGLGGPTKELRQALIAGADAIEKAFTNPENITRADLDNLEAAKGDEVTDDSGDIDYSGLKEQWKLISDEQKEALYGGTDEAAYEKFEKQRLDQIKNFKDAFSNADAIADKLGITLSTTLGTASSQALANIVSNLFPGGSNASASDPNKTEAQVFNDALNTFLAGKTTEQASSIISQIGAIDRTDKAGWDSLAQTFVDLGIVADSSDQSLANLITTGKQVSNAIDKVDFSKFNEQVSNTISLLNKVKEGGRKYSSDDYKAFVAANQGLKEQFIQVGDEYVYLGGHISELTSALEQNTVAILGNTNRVLAQQIQGNDALAALLEDNPGLLSSGMSVSEDELRQNIMHIVAGMAAENVDIASYGIEGLNTSANFAEADSSTLRTWIEEIARIYNSNETLKSQQQKQMRDANIVGYTLNSRQFNIEHSNALLQKTDENGEFVGYENNEWFDEHAEALKIQAIEAGVGELELSQYQAAFDAYKKVVDDNSKIMANSEVGSEEYNSAQQAILDAQDAFSIAASNLASATEAEVVKEEEAEERASLLPLAEKITEQLEKTRQDQIDKLSEVNESINSATTALINKIQEQINTQREQRENEKARENISSLYSQAAYLAADTSGTNAIGLLDTKQQIEDAEQEYQDTLIDQAIQRLQDQNDKAAEQREQQISLMQAQLDRDVESGLLQEQAAQILNEGLEQYKNGTALSNTRLGQILAATTAEMGGFQKADAEADWREMVSEAVRVAVLHENNNDNNNENNKTNNTGDLNDNTYSGGVDGGGQVDVTKLHENMRQDAVNQAFASVKRSNVGLKVFRGTEDYKTQLSRYKETYKQQDGTYSKEDKEIEAEFNKALEGKAAGKLSGHFPNTTAYLEQTNSGWDAFWSGQVNGKAYFGDQQISDITFKYEKGEDAYSAEDNEKITALSGGTPSDGWLAYYNGAPTVYWNGEWKKLNSDSLKNAMHSYLNAFKTGGLADFTGPAWLDGTKSKPEYVLNSAQTEKFFSLIDVLERYDADKQTTQKSGDSYFDININVDKLESDYDVEQMADKIRRMIYDDATYRNVNAINHIR